MNNIISFWSYNNHLYFVYRYTRKYLCYFIRCVDKTLGVFGKRLNLKISAHTVTLHIPVPLLFHTFKNNSFNI